MTRLVQRHRDGPYAVTVGSETKSICGCGLSGALPFCDGTHEIALTEEPGTLHWYDSLKRRHETVDRYPGIRSDEPARRPLMAEVAPSIDIAPQPVSER